MKSIKHVTAKPGQIVFGVIALLCGLACWLVVGPSIIGFGVDADGCLTSTGWIGLIVSLFGIGISIFGASRFIQ